MNPEKKPPDMAIFSIDGPRPASVKVHFNPVSLKLGYTNTIGDVAEGAHQVSAKSASKLDLEIVFDTSETGEDVRIHSAQLRAMALVEKVPDTLPKVTFAWGAFSFTGSIESLSETIDFFSPGGTPLRLTAQIAMKGLKLDKPKSQDGNPSGAGGAQTRPAPAGGLGATGFALSIGDPRAGRALAAFNGLESMRFPGASALAMNTGGVELKGPEGLSGPSDLAGGLAAFAGLGASRGGATGITLRPPPAAPLEALTTGAQHFDLTGKLAGAAGGRT
jgi:Contractile injection system tube protein